MRLSRRYRCLCSVFHVPAWWHANCGEGEGAALLVLVHARATANAQRPNDARGGARQGPEIAGGTQTLETWRESGIDNGRSRPSPH